MTREDLFWLCNEYVRNREAAEHHDEHADPAPEILRSFRLAEISESEMEALLSYVSDSDEDDLLGLASRELDLEDALAPCVGEDDGERESAGPQRPR